VLSSFCVLFPSFAEVYTFLRAATGQFGGASVSILFGASADANYGESVALNAAGTTLAVGAPKEPGNGAVFVYTAAAGTGAWVLQQTLTANTFGFSTNALFGSRVALNSAGDTLVIGAPSHAWDSGGLIVFLLSGGIWSAQSPILVPVDVTGAAQFGVSLALNAAGDRIAGGGPWDDGQGFSTGVVCTYKRDGSGVWSYEQKLLPSDFFSTTFRYFGVSVALSASGNTLIIGADGELGTGAWWSAKYTLPKRAQSCRLAHPCPPCLLSSLVLLELSGTLSSTAQCSTKSVRRKLAARETPAKGPRWPSPETGSTCSVRLILSPTHCLSLSLHTQPPHHLFVEPTSS
jgi:hypothetical protein